MNKDDATGRLNRQLAQIRGLKSSPRNSTDFKKWRRNTKVAISRIFGQESQQSNDFSKISWTPSAYNMSDPDPAFNRAYLNGLDSSEAILASMIDEVQEYWEEGDEAPRSSSIGLVKLICSRFHVVARQLRSRRENRPTIEIEDEYDVQDLAHALLKLHFEDVRAEEWTPSYAGKSARMDFLLKGERIVLEIKKTRPGLDIKNIGDELAIDIVRYKIHPDCSTLVCFVYDPEGRIGYPASIENDLSGDAHGLDVIAIVAPRGT